MSDYHIAVLSSDEFEQKMRNRGYPESICKAGNRIHKIYQDNCALVKTLRNKQYLTIGNEAFMNSPFINQKKSILGKAKRGLEYLCELYNRDRLDQKDPSLIYRQYQNIFNKTMYLSINPQKHLVRRWYFKKYTNVDGISGKWKKRDGKWINVSESVNGKWKKIKNKVYKPSNDLFAAFLGEETFYKGNEGVMHLIDKSVYVAMEPGCERYINKTNNMFDNNNMRYVLEAMNGFKKETLREHMPEFDPKTTIKKQQIASNYLSDPKRLSPIAKQTKYETSSHFDNILITPISQNIQLSFDPCCSLFDKHSDSESDSDSDMD